MEVINMSGDNSVRHDTESANDMHKAAKEGDLEELKRLLLAGEDPTNLDGKNRTPLHWACGFAVQNTTLEMVEAILESPKVKAQSDTEQKLVNYKDDFGNTALHEAARRGHGLVIKKLLFSGANPSLKNEEKHSALHEVFKKKPTAMIPTYNEAVTALDKTDAELEKSPENKDAKSVTGNQTQRPSWTIDFLGLVGSIDKSSASFEFLRPETEWLSICLELSDTKQSQLFMHPVVRTFLHLKWKKIRILLWLSVLYHILWLILYTYFNVDLYLMHCPFAVPAEENDTDYEMTTTDLITEDPPTTEDYYDQDIKSMGVKSALDITGMMIMPRLID
ncbi:unnamed protein product [Orchesella dallaii]|uniref:Uncharacterized protein n=1 Tax=Orchesella dallaii TaxID=48710 RepID=A0ABP1RQ41_9HEXA